MVSRIKPLRRVASRRAATPAPSRDRLLEAAAQEFAARGFDGAKVDRIAARARINKAMLYYHFHNKADLYRAILAELFRTMAEAVTRACDAALTPEAQLRLFIRTIAAEMAARPHYPAIWLREMAEGGRHVDAPIVGELRSVLDVLARILQRGRKEGVFGGAHPVITQMGIVGPLLLFAASAPARERFSRLVPQFSAAAVPVDALVTHVETATLAAVAPAASQPVAPRRSSRRPRR
ncbi:MAG: TetR/AcrR family transcriptional regulator [Vicinamibacterales bacterium]